MSTNTSSAMSATSEVHSLKFNQNFGCFICGMTDGIRIFNTEPLVEKLYLNKDADKVGSVAIAEMLDRTNLIAIVSGGNFPIIAPNNVLIWDDDAKEFILEFTFKSKVFAVKLSHKKLIVVLHNKIHVFSFPNNCQKLFTFNTCDNPRGLCEVSASDDENQLLCFPAVKSGFMQVADISLAEESASKCPRIFAAHKHEIACMALDQGSNRLATASIEGTLIRIFEINPRNDVKQLIELRRGMDSALLYSINFSRDGGYLCASSSKGTVHVYNLEDQHFNRQLKLATLGFNTSNFEARYSMCTFQIPCELPCICAFGDNCNSVLCICVNGSYYKYMFTNDGKQCTRDSYENFLDLSLGSDF